MLGVELDAEGERICFWQAHRRGFMARGRDSAGCSQVESGLRLHICYISLRFVSESFRGARAEIYKPWQCTLRAVEELETS